MLGPVTVTGRDRLTVMYLGQVLQFLKRRHSSLEGSILAPPSQFMFSFNMWLRALIDPIFNTKSVKSWGEVLCHALNITWQLFFFTSGW